MNFSDGELVFMNSISEGNLYEIKFTTPGIINEDRYIDDTLRELKKKDILTHDNKLSSKGAVYTYIFECFKSSRKLLIINNLHIALIENSDNAICILKKDDNSAEMLIIKAYEILYKLIMDFKYLREETKEENIQQERIIDTEQWNNYIKTFKGEALNISYSEYQKKIYQKVFYSDNKNGYEFDLLTNKERTITPQDIRIFFMELLGININKR